MSQTLVSKQIIVRSIDEDGFNTIYFILFLKKKKKKKKTFISFYSSIYPLNKNKKIKSHQSFKRNWHYIQVFQPLMFPFLNNFLLLHLVLGFHSNQQYLLHFSGFVLIWFDQNNTTKNALWSCVLELRFLKTQLQGAV